MRTNQTIRLFCNKSTNNTYFQPSCPFENSSALQNVFQTYVGALLRKSFKQKVTCRDDFWQLEKKDRASHIRTLTASFSGSNNSMWKLLWILARVSWIHNAKAFLNSGVTVICQFMYYLCLS